MSEEEQQNPNPMIFYIALDLQEEIILRLPLKSIRKFRTSVSKEWRSIIESKSFAERRSRMSLLQQSRLQILAAGGEVERRIESRFQGDEEVDVVYLHCDDVTRPSLTCDGLVCIPVPGWVNVLNPSTGDIIRFPSGPDPVTRRYSDLRNQMMDLCGKCCIFFPAFWAMGFGRDKVNGSFKVVRMFFDPHHYCEVLDINIGEWRRSVRAPPYVVDPRRKSACVNGSIYWLGEDLLKLLALDLHTLEFRDVPSPRYSTPFTFAEQLVNLDGRLAVATTATSPWRLEILTMDAQKEDGWALTYSIHLYSCLNLYTFTADVHFRPVAVSKQGNLFFHDNEKRLLKFYPSTNLIRCISKHTLVISPFIENWLPLLPPKTTTSRISIGPKFPLILLAAHVSFLVFRYYFVSSRS
ncbi:PREDICTED: F-box/LRR-repeat protein At2g43260-like [Camelina sativa]|uniref:F-box/LRR-repeat protein At2g43260-like n=1 Tax=Camelina sativa TaxID=90675 RepID=A0ABM0YZZ0_CAMSA|nr:PREDICTED: F-box/LRR-repeat protein At2g43260-like [Camelina sativa]